MNIGMNRKVKLFLSGLHSATGEETAKLETLYDAEYYKRNDSHYLFYEEQQEGDEEKTKVRIKLKDSCMELTRQGATKTLMVFEKNRKHMTRYVTPYGEMMLGIDTKDICVEESEHAIKVTIAYLLEADGQYLSDCRIELRIEA